MYEEDSSDLQHQGDDLDVDLHDEVDEPEHDEEAEESEGEAEQGERSEKSSKTSFVDTAKIADPELRKQVEGRIGELYRQGMEGKKAQAEAKKLKDELDAIRNKQELVEVEAPSVDLAIDDPRKFAEQQKAHSEYLAKKYAHDQQEQAKAKQVEEANKKATQERLAAYEKRVVDLKISEQDLKVATDHVVSAGLNSEVRNYLLGHKIGPAIVKYLGFNFEDLYAISNLSTADAVEYIVENVAPKAMQKRTPSAPPPPTKVQGARNSDSAPVKNWKIS